MAEPVQDNQPKQSPQKSPARQPAQLPPRQERPGLNFDPKPSPSLMMMGASAIEAFSAAANLQALDKELSPLFTNTKLKIIAVGVPQDFLQREAVRMSPNIPKEDLEKINGFSYSRPTTGNGIREEVLLISDRAFPKSGNDLKGFADLTTTLGHELHHVLLSVNGGEKGLGQNARELAVLNSATKGLTAIRDGLKSSPSPINQQLAVKINDSLIVELLNRQAFQARVAAGFR